MTAAVEATGQGTWRAICRDEDWRTGHLHQHRAAALAADHNDDHHQASSR